MPTLNITGHTVQVDDSFTALSPEQQNATVDEIAQSLGPSVSASGIGKAALSGAGEGLTQIAGIPGDLLALGGKAIGSPQLGKIGNALGSEAVKHKVEQYTGDFYKPQNRAEEIANTAGSFAPLAAGGVSGIGRRILTNVVAPTAGTEIAGELTKGTDAQPYAQVAGALIGGAGATKLLSAEKAAIKAAGAGAPEQADILAKSTAGYKHPAVASVQLKPTATSSLADDIVQKMKSEGVAPQDISSIDGRLAALRAPNNPSAALVSDIENARKALGDVKPTDSAYRAATIARKEIDSWFNRGIRPSDVLSGDADAANRILKQARYDYSTFKASKQISDALERASIKNDAAHSGGNLGNYTRQELKPILMEQMGVAKRKGYQTYTSPELKQLSQAARGTVADNILRYGGKLLGGGGGIGALGTGYVGAEASGATGPEAALTGAMLALLGRRLNTVASNRTVARAKQLEALIRSRATIPGKDAQMKLLADLKQSDHPIAQSILRAIIAGRQHPVGILSGQTIQ